MGLPTASAPPAPPPETKPNRSKATLDALAFAQQQNKLRQSTGRQGSFLTRGSILGGG